MRNRKNRIRSIALSGIIAASMLLSGCGKKTSMWTFHIEDMEIDMATSFTDILELLDDNDIYGIDPITLKVYDTDGEDSKISINKNIIENDGFVFMWHEEDDDEELTSFSITKNRGLFKKYESADKINRKTDEDDLPDNYLYLASYNRCDEKKLDDLHNYYAVIVDGKYVDLSKYVENLPEEFTEDTFDECYAMFNDLGRLTFLLLPEKLVSCVTMTYSEEMKDLYDEDDAFKNVVATIYALSDIYEDFKDDKIENFGTISYSYIDGDMNAFDYYIISKN